MRRLAFIVLLAVVGGLLGAAPAVASSRTGRLLVLLSSPARAHAAVVGGGPLARATSVRATELSVPEIGLLVVRPAPGRTLGEAAGAVRVLPGVTGVEIETRARLRGVRVPNDPALGEPEPSPDVPPGTPRQWAPAREMFPSAWSLQRGFGARVGVIDTGIDGTHPDFAHKVLAANIPAGDESHRPATSDQDGHGTHVASLACAGTDNGVGLAGAGFGCRLVVEKVDLSEASVVAGIVDATKRHVSAINMSFGFDGTGRRPALERALDYAVRRRVVLVAAAADDAAPGHERTEQGAPANLLQPQGTAARLGAGKGIVVTAADFGDHRANFAGSGSEISLSAYGTYHPGTPPLYLDRQGPPGLFGAFPSAHTSFDDGLGCSCRTTFHGATYAYLEGTSMATPQVAGAAALVRALNPDLSARAVVRLLKQTARRSHGWSANLGWGILDAGRALRLASRIDGRAPSSRLRLGGPPQGKTVLLRWSGVDRGPRGVRVSGIAHFDVLAARDGARPRVIARTRRRSMHVRLLLRPGSRYAFFTEAVDRAGNRERAPRHADAAVRGAPAG